MPTPVSKEASSPPRKRGPRVGRAEAVVASVRSATLKLLATVGYDKVEIPDIAAEAGVNRTTVYRRWPTKSALVMDIMLEEMSATVPLPDTGSFQGDLEKLLLDVNAALAQPLVRAVLQALMASSQANTDENTAAKKAFWDQRFAVSGELVTRAVARGEVPAGTVPRTVLELAASPLFFRNVVTGERWSDAEIKLLARSAARAFSR